MKIGLFGQFGSGNTGNDGSLEAMLHVLNRISPDAQLVCICSSPEIITPKFRIQAVSVGQAAPAQGYLRLLNKLLFNFPRRLTGFIAALTLAQGLDLIIVPGTGILDDFNENPFGWPFAILRWSIAARLAGARFAFISIGAGPVTHPLSRAFIRRAALLASHRSYRDQVSYDFMRSLGVSARYDGVSADIAFALPVADDVLTKGADQRIGVGVMNYRGWRKNAEDGAAIYDTYLNKMARLVEGLLDQGRQVRLLIGDQGDLAAVNDLQSRLRHRDQGNVVFEPPASLQELMQQIALTDIVVASRYHNIVCALAMTRPAISIGYAKKNDALLNDTGLGAYCHQIETFDPQHLLEQIDQLFACRAELVMVVERGVNIYRRRLEQQEEVLRTLLL
ncbi:polysaccharide pyruvyl transferase family protein [Ochrobactrum sp. Sa2BUA5]|nr:polysaccharide pyruvyl transferase family protein [Ochrobactrum gallinarum]